MKHVTDSGSEKSAREGARLGTTAIKVQLLFDTRKKEMSQLRQVKQCHLKSNTSVAVTQDFRVSVSCRINISSML